MKYSIALLDDEILSLEATKGIIDNYFSDFNIIGTFNNPLEALKVLSTTPCDILICDVRMPGMNGLEFVQTLRSFQSPHVIFLTGFDKYAIQAIKAAAFDYLLKPLTPQSLGESLKRLKDTERNKSDLSDLSSGKLFDRLLVNRNDKMILLEYRDINRLYANGPYTHIYLTNDEQVVATKPMKYFDQALTDKGFIRPHRAHIFNVYNISEVRKGSDGNGVVSFKKGKEVYITQECKNQLTRHISLMHSQNLDS